MPDFTSLANYKTATGTTGVGDDALINLLLPEVSALMLSVMGRTGYWLESGRSEFPLVRGETTRNVYLDLFPMTTITSLWVSQALPRVYDASTLLVNGADYLIDEASGIVERQGLNWPDRLKAVKVLYDGGIDPATAIPADLARAAQEIIQTKLQKMRGKLYHLTGQALGEGQIKGIRFDDIPTTALRVLHSHRDMRMGP